MKLTEANYYSPEANREFFSVSLLKRFMDCEAAAMAELNGEYEPQKGRALTLGSFVDEMLTGTPESRAKFLEENKSELMKKNGEFYADVAQAADAVARAQKQPLFMKFVGGEHQRIFTGEIAGVPFKGKLDSYKKGEFICDLKYVRSLRSPNMFENFIDYWDYHMQLAVYRELVYQQTNEKLPCYIATITKESPPHIAVLEIDQLTLDRELERVKALVPRYQKIKNGEIPPERCQKYDCDFCTETSVLTEPIPYELCTMSAAEIKAMRGEN